MTTKFSKKLSNREKRWEKNQEKRKRLLTQFLMGSVVLSRVLMPGVATAADEFGAAKTITSGIYVQQLGDIISNDDGSRF